MARTTTPTALSAERWQRVSACFEQALETPADTRVRYVEATFAHDPDSCREVLAMLKASGDLGLLFTEVLDILTAKLPAGHPNRQALMGNVAASRDRLGDYEGAEALARELVAQRRASNPVVPLALGAALEYLATTIARRGYLNDADSLMREAMTLRSGNVARTHLDVIRGLQNRAMIAMARPTRRRARVFRFRSRTSATVDHHDTERPVGRTHPPPASVGRSGAFGPGEPGGK